jgi:hypothetical protein
MNRAFAAPLIALLALSGAPATTTASPPPGGPARFTTAKAALQAATARAKSWQGDAVLVDLNTYPVNPDGTARVWNYIFYSELAPGKAYSVTMGMEESAKEFPLDSAAAKAPRAKIALREFLDSDQAVQAAQRAGFSTTGKKLFLGLQREREVRGDSAPRWFIGRPPWSDINAGIVIDATTGKRVPFDPKTGKPAGK